MYNGKRLIQCDKFNVVFYTLRFKGDKDSEAF